MENMAVGQVHEGKMGINYAQAKRMTAEMFGSSARLEKGFKKEDGKRIARWVIVVPVKTDAGVEFAAVGAGGTFDSLFRDVARHRAFAEERARREAQKQATGATASSDVGRGALDLEKPEAAISD